MLLLCSCVRESSVTSEPFGTLSTGEEATLWHLVKASGDSQNFAFTDM